MLPSITKPGYWAIEESPREYCYKIRPLSENGEPKFIAFKEWAETYLALGNLGYRFRDSGHNHEKIIVSLT